MWHLRVLGLGVLPIFKQKAIPYFNAMYICVGLECSTQNSYYYLVVECLPSMLDTLRILMVLYHVGSHKTKQNNNNLKMSS